jgi:hypothetical protein
MSADLFVGLLLAIAAIAYLANAMLRPEHF